ncbi:hypothetical protein [Chrysodeixis includens nucleopolyhedrovirus]|uniref:Uncharacterized protein n=1 Tax=Chrysodeixis includens nucleopolyhedrovirus TaxID=1207438 RepID=A0A1C8ZX79_9ABAC|nr:hypothetical protein [Chrysodeixis includens nucleopolyhedrovirus]AOL56697.1 hypothetical protein [Chrysodeixis includens nucleopolyhedrovirus]AOL56839.1 hypothetical protein [Chrysodeixis includens nucleopolyhedrovirus]AOL56981.1 hypothetical protein [Chrysodeixis includens nucleopolyhedrovirus]
MESILERFHYHRSIPYISKKLVNDILSDRVLQKLNRIDNPSIVDDENDNVGSHHIAKKFHQEILEKTHSSLKTFTVVKGGAAIAAHLEETNPFLADIDIEIYVDDFDFNHRVNINNLTSFVALTSLEKNLRKISQKYYVEIEKILRDFDIEKLFKDAANDVKQAYNVDDDNDDRTEDQKSVIIFKSYVNEAVEFNVADVELRLNRRMPFKTTVSKVNEEYFLVRYSFNVHMVATSESSMRLYRRSDIKELNYFVFDVYFLDLTVKNYSAMNSAMNKPVSYLIKPLYDTNITVECIDNVVADQIECLMFNVFNYQDYKIKNRLSKLRKLIGKTYYPVNTRRQLQNYYYIKNSNAVFEIKNLKNLLYLLNPTLGSDLIIQLYLGDRLVNNINDITHQVNFPYHVWENNYFTKCWYKFMCILNDLFELNYTI